MDTQKIRKSLFGESLNEGDAGYLIKASRPTGWESYRLSAQPGRTNMSGQERLDGWLGMTDNINRYARGYRAVTNITRTHYHLTAIDEPA